jgi:hypothetical protein
MQQTDEMEETQVKLKAGKTVPETPPGGFPRRLSTLFRINQPRVQSAAGCKKEE